MIFAIHAYENVYGGLHGIETYFVSEFDSEDEAEEYAKDISIDLMDMYHEIIEDFYQEATDEGFELYSPEWEEYVEECVNDNVAYEIYEVTKEIPRNEINADKLTEEFKENPKGFIDKYCR